MSELIINTDVLTDTEKAIAEFLAAKVRQTEEEKKVKMPWKPEYLERYFGIGFNGDISSSTNSNSIFDREAWVIGNCFKTKDEADFAAERLRVIAELKRFANEHNPANFDRNEYGVDKWYLYYDQSDKHVHAAYNRYGLNSEAIFANSDVTKAAIEKIGEDRLKKYYFGIS